MTEDNENLNNVVQKLKEDIVDQGNIQIINKGKKNTHNLEKTKKSPNFEKMNTDKDLEIQRLIKIIEDFRTEELVLNQKISLLETSNKELIDEYKLIKLTNERLNNKIESQNHIIKQLSEVFYIILNFS